MFERIYAWMLKLYPAAFRGEYGDAMRQVFRDRLQAERGAGNRLRLWFDVLRDLAVSVPREYRRLPVAVPQPGIYRLSEEAVREAAGPGRFGSIGYLCLTVAVGLVAGFAGKAPRGPLVGVYSLVVALIFPMVILDRRRRKNRLRGFEVVLESNRILVKDHGQVAVTVLKAEVTKLQEVRHRGHLIGMRVGRAFPGNGILAPAGLIGYNELCEQLSGWAAVEPWTPPSGLKRRHLAWAVTMCPAALLVRSPHYVWPLAALVGIGLLVLAVSLRRKKLGPLPLPLIPIGLAALLVAKVLFTVLARQ